jgi:tetratricopeptide (TPR) repeat protein
VKPAGDVPLIGYPILDPEKKARGLDWIGNDPERDQAFLTSPIFTGTIMVSARRLGKKPFWDPAPLRAMVPTARFGDLLVFRGKCDCGAILAPRIYHHALSKIYAQKPDLAAGEQLLRQSLSFDPSAFFVDIELGNLYLKRGERDQALQAFSAALKYAPSNDAEMHHLIADEIQRISTQPVDKVPDLRNPLLE